MKTKVAAQKLQSMGQGGDTILAHINVDEADALKGMGGSGKRNPKTGLLSFDYGGFEGGDLGFDAGDFGGANTNAQDSANLAAFDASQPSQMDPGLAFALGLIGIPAGALNMVSGSIAGRNTGAGYGPTYAGGLQTGGFGQQSGGSPASAGNQFSGGGMQGDFGGGYTPPNPMMTINPVAQGPQGFMRQPFVPKFGKPRGLLDQPQIRGLLGG